MSFFRNIYYRWHLTYSFLYEIDHVLTISLLRSISSGIKSVSHDDYLQCRSGEPYTIEVLFRDGCKASLWNANKYYSWCCNGVIYFPTGKKYSWNNRRPSVECMFKLKQALESIPEQEQRNPQLIVDELYYLDN